MPAPDTGHPTWLSQTWSQQLCSLAEVQLRPPTCTRGMVTPGPVSPSQVTQAVGEVVTSQLWFWEVRTQCREKGTQGWRKTILRLVSTGTRPPWTESVN